MTMLQIILHQPYAKGLLETGALVSVRRLTDIKGEPVKNWWSREKPVPIVGGDGIEGVPTSFELPGGGYYGVDITLPRGPGIFLEFLLKRGERRTQRIPLEASPHEYLSWHQYAGIVRPNLYQQETVSIPSAPKSEHLISLYKQSQKQIDSLYNGVTPVPKIFAAKVPASQTAWEQIASTARGGDRNWTMASPLPDYATDWDNEYATWFLGSPRNDEGIELIRQMKTSLSIPDALCAKYPRWITFHSADKIDLASIPWSWWGARKQDGEEIRVVYDRIRSNAINRDTPGRLVVSVLDQRWFGMLEFLASGRLSRTGRMFDQVLNHEAPEDLFNPEMALYGKVKGPLVATAGAIVLIARAESKEKQPWDTWVENLSNWFPGIPDGLILLGCRRVDQAHNLTDLSAAFKLLEEGVARGIPFFSATIQMLSVTLSQIENDVPNAGVLRRFIASVLTRVDPEQTFTVISL